MKKYQILLSLMILLAIFYTSSVEAATSTSDIPKFQEVTETVPNNTLSEDIYEPATPTPISKLAQQFSGRFEEKYTYGDKDFYLDIKAADNSELIFTSKNNNIVTVSPTGKVSIIGAGTTYIIVTTKENENYLAGKTKIKVKIFRKSIKNVKLIVPQFGDILQFDSFGLNGNNKKKNKEEYDWEALYDRVLFFDGDKCLQRNKDYYVSESRVGIFGNYLIITGENNYKGERKFEFGNINAPRMSCLNPTNNGINVSWYGSDSSLGYIVYRKTGNGKYKKIARIDNGKIQSYFDADKKMNGKSYTYKVKVITRNKKKYLYKSSENTITLRYLTAPDKLKVRQKSNGQVYATWRGNKKADGYEVCCLENKNDNKNTAFKYSFEGKNTTKGDLITLQKGKTYYVYVRAYTQIKGGRYYSDWSKGKKIKVK